MKKINLIALGLALVLSFSACSSDTTTEELSSNEGSIVSQVAENAEELYKHMTEENEEYTYLDATTSIALSMTAEDETIALTLDMNLKADLSDEESPLMSATTSISIAEMGLSMNTNLFYVDGYQYIETMGQKIKAEIPLESVFSLIQSAAPKLVSSDDISDFEAVEEGDNIIYSFTVQGEEMNELYEEVTALAQEVLGLSQQTDTDFEAITCNMVTSGNSILSQEIKMSLDTVIGGEPCEMAITASTNFNSIDEVVVVDIPSDLSGYTEIGG